MPILHVKRSSSEDEDVPNDVALVRDGPIVEVSMGVAQSMAEEWRNAGKDIPDPVSGYALIDTGASNTCIDNQVAEELGLPAIDVVRMLSASEETEQYVYPAQIDVVGSPVMVDAPKAIGANLQDRNMVALIGRDLLSETTLRYNGAIGEFTLSI